MHQAVEKLVDDLRKEFPHLTFRVDPPNGTYGGWYFIDVLHKDQMVWSIQACTTTMPITYGFTFIDEDVGPFDLYPDMATGHAPTMIKYLKMLLPKE